MQSPLDQMAKTYMEIDARTAYTYEAITVTEASTQNLVDAGIQYLAAYKDDAGQWLTAARRMNWSAERRADAELLVGRPLRQRYALHDRQPAGKTEVTAVSRS